MNDNRTDKLTAEQVWKAIEEAEAELLESCEYVGDMGQRKSDVIKTFDKLKYAITDELGSVECTPHGEWKRITQTQEVRHVFCECGYELGMDERDSFPLKHTRLFAMPNYCKECGRKIRKAVKR